jgi:DNA-directed RNA polymerase specialized sigma24 family protein
VNPWQQQALAHWDMINRMAGRRFRQAVLAEEAALFVMDGLARDDWQRLQAFTGRSTLATYVGALTLRLLEDFARIRFGRVRPPLWIQRLGGIWMTLFRLLCLERFSPDEAVAMVGNHHPGQDRVAEEAAFRILGEIPTCGEHRGETDELHEETTLPPSEDDCSAQEQKMEAEERRQLFTLLGRMLFDAAEEGEDQRLLERVAEVGIRLEPMERLLLQLCYRDGVAVAEAGRMLGLNRHQVHGRLRRLLERLRQDFVAAGLADELRLLL